MTTSSFEVIIIGAGSTGLLLAQGLKQANIKTTVFERESASTYQTRPREWGMTLHWGAAWIEKCVPPEMQGRLNEICCDPFYGDKDLTLPHYNAKTGEKLFDMPGTDPRRVSRRRLRNFLSQGLDIHYGKKLKDVQRDSSNKVVATFEDGTSAEGTVLIGCDGAKSAVRPCLVGEKAAELVDLNIHMFNLSCSFPKEIALLQRKSGHPIFKNSYHPAGFAWWQSIQDVKDPNDPESWLFQNVLSWIGDPRPEDFPDQESRLKFWRTKAEDFAEPWKSVGANLPTDVTWKTDRITYWKPVDWSSAPLAGVVTLAGDAAHAMPPFRGQGLNNALEDAGRLIEALTAAAKGQKSLPEALSAFEVEMRERVLTEMPVSILQAENVHIFDKLMDAPFFKHGMHKYREDRQAAGLGVEQATEPSTKVEPV